MSSKKLEREGSESYSLLMTSSTQPSPEGFGGQATLGLPRHSRKATAGVSGASCYFFLILISTLIQGLLAQPAWDDQLDFQDIAYRLQHELIKKNERFAAHFERQGKQIRVSDKMRLIELESGLLGVFKPGEYAQAEVAAYKASSALGLRLVPPTVLRNIDGITGSLQFYIAHAVSDPLERARYFKKLPKKDISDMHCFYYVFGQWDIHPGNQVIAVSHNKPFLALIDNAGMLHLVHGKLGERPFIEKGKARGTQCSTAATFPFDEIQSIHSQDRDLPKLFGKSIPKQVARLQLEDHIIRYVFWKDILWMEAKHALGKIEHCSFSMAEALRKLTSENLKEIWSEWYAISQEHAEQLIQLTFSRRDYLLAAVHIS